VRFDVRKRRENKLSEPSRSRDDAAQVSKGVEEAADGTPSAVDQREFHFRSGVHFGARARPGRNGTPVRKRDANWAASLGSVEDEDLEREVSRSRRFGHPFVLARVSLRRTGPEAHSWHEETLVLLSSVIRTFDRVWFDGKDVYLLLPRSDRAGGSAALARLREPLSRVLSEEELDGITFAVFALDECPTKGALLSALHGRVKNTKAEAAGPPENTGVPVADPQGAGR
jgi:hypothetical protein